MDRSKQREKPLICEAHHIIPKSLGGSNSEGNIAYLTPREHFISHALLTKMVEDKRDKISMAFAFIKMKVSNNKSGYVRVGNGKLYETLRVGLRELYSGENNPFYGDSRFSGENNPFYGKKHSNETIQKLKNRPKKCGKDNHFYGKTHSKTTKDIISKNQSEPVTIIFIDGTKKQCKKKTDIGSLLGVSKSMGVHLCSIKRHLWSKYNIKEILDENIINQKSSN
jgi:hypothetical protein